jgi:importin subunit beta-1
VIPQEHRKLTSASLAQALQQYVQAIFALLALIATDINRSESLMRASMGVIGYVFL